MTKPIQIVEYAKYSWFEFIRIFNPVYRRTIEIGRGDINKAKKGNELLNKLPEDDRETKGYCIREWLYTVIRLNRLEWQTLIHELQHWIFWRYQQILDDIEINSITEEFFTYSMEFCLDCIVETPLYSKMKRTKWFDC